jgi:hypothetical protein
MLTLVRNGKSEYRIVVAEGADPLTLQAAHELALHVEKISGADLPIVTDTTAENQHEILVGFSGRSDRHEKDLNKDTLGKEGFVIKTTGDKILIAGNTGLADLYGVYTFLEECLGCRLYAPGVKYVPSSKDIRLKAATIVQIPVFAYREAHLPGPILDEEFCHWHKIHHRSKKETEWGDLWVHTFNRLVPPATYFKTHPEYYSEINGIRVPDGQLCLSNPDVLRLVVRNLREKMAEKPGAYFWSVSQNDCFKACTCKKCRAIDSLYGGYSGSILNFVNKVADSFPGKIISTLAYSYSRHAPGGIKPRKNVNIMLCSIECNRSKPLAADTGRNSFVHDLREWSKLTSNILIWDYIVQFRNYLDPFPNLAVLQPNLRLFAEYKAPMMFQQGSGRSWSDMVELKQYLVARLLWNPYIDVDETMNDFLNGYYGEAGPVIREYIDRLHDALERSGDSLIIYGFPFDGFDSYLSPALLKEYERLFDQAGAAVKDNPVLLGRVKKARLPIQFARLDISLTSPDGEFTYFTRSPGGLQVKPGMTKLLDDFVAEAEAQGITTLNEGGLTPLEYGDMIRRSLEASLEPNLAYGKPVDVLTTWSPKYPAGGPMALTNGIRGINDYHFHWLGFEGEDMIAVVDLGKVMPVHSVSADFIQQVASWIFLPLKVDFLVSEDGKNFKRIGSCPSPEPEDKEGSFISTCSSGIDRQLLARYIRVEAVSMKTCPRWHQGFGYPSWIFCDEIVVR